MWWYVFSSCDVSALPRCRTLSLLQNEVIHLCLGDIGRRNADISEESKSIKYKETDNEKNHNGAFSLLSFEAAAGAGDVAIGKLPSAENEDFRVCYDQASGQLGNCPNVRAIIVDCPGESINTKLSDVPQGNWINVTINGTCNENVEITEWGIQLLNISFNNGVDGKIIGVDPSKATISAWGNNTVFVHGLEISGNGRAGVAARSGASQGILPGCSS